LTFAPFLLKQSDCGPVSVDTYENLQANLARATKAVKREDVMRDALTFHVLRMTPVANSANIAADVFSQPQTTLFSKRSNGGRARADIDENGDADSADATHVRGQKAGWQGRELPPA